MGDLCIIYYKVSFKYFKSLFRNIDNCIITFFNITVKLLHNCYVIVTRVLSYNLSILADEGSILRNLISSNKQPHISIRLTMPSKQQKLLLEFVVL